MNHQPSIITTQQKCVVIVDAMSTGRYLPATFASLGYPCVHVKNTIARNTYFDRTFSSALFSRLVEYRGSIDEVVTRVQDLEVVAVVAGSEPGVELAIELGQRLGRPLTDGRLSRTVFRDKAELYATLGYDQRFYVKVVSDSSELDHESIVSHLPLVVKPIDEVGSSKVKICDRVDEVQVAIHSILRSPDMFNRSLSRRAVIMSKIPGTEYMVNTVSANGKHRVIEVWRTKKAFFDASPAYGIADLMEPGRCLAECVEQVACDSLQQLGVLNGAAHIEIIDPEDGTSPVVIDFGLRLQGLVDPSCPLAAYGSTPMLETALAVLDPEGYAARPRLAYRRRCRSITLHTPRGGILRTEAPWGLLEAVPGVHSVRKAALRPGAVVSRTNDGFSSFGTVYLIGDESEIERATMEVRNVELNSEFYGCIA